MMVHNQLVDDLTADAQGTDRFFLVGLHEPAITDHIGRQDGRKSTLDVLPCHGSAPGSRFVDCSLRKAVKRV